jgi:hypothetical protein
MDYDNERRDDADDDLDQRPRRPRGAPPPRVLGDEETPARLAPRPYVPADRAPAPRPRDPGPRPDPSAYRERSVSRDPPVTYAPVEPPPAPAARRPTGSACIWLLALAAIVVLACGLLGFGALQSGVNGLVGMVPRFPGLPVITPTVVIQPQGPSVVEQIQSLSRLETAQYTVKTVLTGESTGPIPPLTSDKILFIAYGQVVAGVDLSKLTDADVQVVSNTVTLRLPAAEILSSRLDNDKSNVYDRQTGFFTKADPNLESQIRQKAEQEIRQEALEGGILSNAQTNAEKTVRVLLEHLQYDRITFLPPSGAVPAPAATESPTP